VCVAFRAGIIKETSKSPSMGTVFDKGSRFLNSDRIFDAGESPGADVILPPGFSMIYFFRTLKKLCRI
jgi:hypothetical protein